MQNIKWFFILLMGFFVACGEEDIRVEEDIDEILEIDSTGAVTANVTHQGDFVSDAHPTSGTAQIVMNENGSKTLVFTNFKSDPGPDLDVYLASDTKARDFVNLGDLKGTSGQFTYDVPANADLGETPYVLIWCVQFSVNFGYAKLEE